MSGSDHEYYTTLRKRGMFVFHFQLGIMEVVGKFTRSGVLVFHGGKTHPPTYMYFSRGCSYEQAYTRNQ